MKVARIARFGVAGRVLVLVAATALALAACGTAPAGPSGHLGSGGSLTPLGSSPTPGSVTTPTTSSDTGSSATPTPPATALAEREFWSIIASTRTSRSTSERAQLLQGRLRTLPPTQIAAFDRQLTEAVNTIGRPSHLGAAEIIMGFTSRNAFVDFRAWVVAQGEQVHSAFASDPDSLVDAGFDREGELVAGEMIAAAPERAYRTVTGRSLEDDFPDLPEPSEVGTTPNGPSYAELALDLPRLAELYLPRPTPTGNAFSDGPRGVDPQR